MSVVEQMSKVSVVIPSYNHEHYITQSIMSVIQQTYKNIELIVIDDGSLDNSVEVIQGLQEQYGFKFETQENMGLTGTLNKALAMATGEYIAFFASDDIMMLDRFEKQVRYMEQNPKIALCGGNMLSIDDSGTVMGKQKMLPERILEFDDIFLKKKKGIPAPTMLYRTNVLKEAGGYDPTVRIEDMYMAFKVTSMGYRIAVLSDVLAYYRYHGDNSMKRLELMLEGIQQVYGFYSDHPQYEQMRVRNLQSYLLMAVKSDKILAKKILKQIPLKHYNLKTIRGFLKMLVT